MQADAVRAARFRGDSELLEAMRADPRLGRQLEDTAALRGRRALRLRLLSHAVRIDAAMLPQLAEPFERLGARFGLKRPLEAYVHAQPEVNAFIARGNVRTIVVLSSAAVNLLTPEELEFVIGHELGHALYGHLEIGVGHLLRDERLPPKVNMRLRAWQRASEISADRAGLLSCGSLEVAANALFKTLSGLALPGDGVSPERLAAQWDHLLDEVQTGGERGPWEVSHPLPPLRAKAMLLFWQGRDQSQEVDGEVTRLLALMDPAGGSRDGELDPVLARFFFWGGLYIALAGGVVEASERARLETVAPAGVDLGQLGELAPESCLESFRAAKEERRAKLTAIELHRIFQGLLDVAAADGKVSDDEVAHLYRLGEVLGIRQEACDLLVAEYLKATGGDDDGG